MYEERKEQKLLYKHLRAAREKHYQAKIFKNKLIVNGESFTYEQLKEKDIQESESIKQNEQTYGSQSAPGTPSLTVVNKKPSFDLTKENTDIVNQESKRKKREGEELKENKVGNQSSSSVSTRSTSSKKAPEVTSSPPAKKTKSK